jgi:hypothetical protein
VETAGHTAFTVPSGRMPCPEAYSFARRFASAITFWAVQVECLSDTVAMICAAVASRSTSVAGVRSVSPRAEVRAESSYSL